MFQRNPSSMGKQSSIAFSGCFIWWYEYFSRMESHHVKHPENGRFAPLILLWRIPDRRSGAFAPILTVVSLCFAWQWVSGRMPKKSRGTSCPARSVRAAPVRRINFYYWFVLSVAALPSLALGKYRLPQTPSPKRREILYENRVDFQSIGAKPPFYSKE